MPSGGGNPGGSDRSGFARSPSLDCHEFTGSGSTAGHVSFRLCAGLCFLSSSVGADPGSLNFICCWYGYRFKLTSPKRAPRNRTLTLTPMEQDAYRTRLIQLQGPVSVSEILNRTICQDLFEILDWLPDRFVDLLFVDPPYNLSKQFNQRQVKRRSLAEYESWLDSWLSRLIRLLKPTASVYICGEWESSLAIYRVACRYFHVRNRITWEREKGRAAKTNWKNCAEDIWFCTVSPHYTFNAEAVRLKRRVRAPYTDAKGQPKDWQSTPQGNYRLTAASNLWSDLTVPFWSMPENTDHPTQKPEKLLANDPCQFCSQ